jgi:hypothetical protein
MWPSLGHTGCDLDDEAVVTFFKGKNFVRRPYSTSRAAPYTIAIAKPFPCRMEFAGSDKPHTHCLIIPKDRRLPLSCRERVEPLPLPAEAIDRSGRPHIVT